MLTLAVVVGIALWPSFQPPSPAEPFSVNPIALGSPQAPVTVTEYADFQCSVCRLMATEITPQLIAGFVEAGVVRLEYKHFAHYGEESLWAGMAAECAHEQGQFWAFHDRLFRVQRSPNTGVFTTTRLKGYAREVGLDAEAFDACLASGRHLAKVRADTQEAIRRGASGTPTIFINDRKLGGVPPMDVLRQLVQIELQNR